VIVGTTPVLDCSVIICAYTDRRWDQLELGYAAVAAQLGENDQLIIVIDHNEDLERRARREFHRALVVCNTESPGLSGARNSGICRAEMPVVVFLDDDACPEPDWLDAYRTAFMDPRVQVVSGAVEPRWHAGAAPVWFPEEFGWVVGCDYRGLPAHGAAVRNPIGANMAIRREALQKVGGFSAAVGRIDTLPLGCEETDLSIRLRQVDPTALIVRNTSARVQHTVPADRTRARYFLSRCYWEGRSKAVLAGRVGTHDGLAAERRCVVATLTRGMLRGLRSTATGQPSGLLRAAAITAGFTATAFGYARGRLRRDTSPCEVTSSTNGTARAGASSAPDFTAWRPMVMAEYRLDGPEDQVTATPGSRTRLLVTSAGSPLGFVDVPSGEAVPPSSEIARQVAVDPPADPPPTPFIGSGDFTPSVSVVIPTRGRSFELVRCVRSVLAVDYPDFEVLVVDNNDRAGAVEELLGPLQHDARLRILHQPVRGASPARNLGIVEGRGEIIAATDDDVIVSARWLAELVAPFTDPRIACVSGLVLPNGFSAPAQEMFEEFGGFGKGFRPVRFDLQANRADRALYPYAVGIYGSGNNVAFRREVVVALGGYDPQLGPGTPARAGEDLDLFLRVLFAGDAIYYQPRAWVLHHHRNTVEALRQQLRDYGRGLSAVMLIWALSDPRRALDIVRRLPAGLRHLLDPSSDKNEARTASYPAELRRSELRGMVEGLFLTAYARLRHPRIWKARALPLSGPPSTTSQSPTTGGRDRGMSHDAV